jgi:hypothetical protein
VLEFFLSLAIFLIPLSFLPALCYNYTIQEYLWNKPSHTYW